HLEVLQQDLALRNAAHAHGRLALSDHEAARGVLLRIAHDDEAADALVLALLDVPGEDQMEPAHAAAGDPVLPAVQHVAIALALGARGHLGRRAARFGLGDADGGLVAGEDEAGGEALLLLRAVLQDGAHRAHVGVHADAASGAAGLHHLLDEHDRLEVRGALGPEPAAIDLRDGHAHEALALQHLHALPWILLGAIGLGRVRRDLGLRDVAHALPEFLDVLRQLEVHGVPSGQA